MRRLEQASEPLLTTVNKRGVPVEARVLLEVRYLLYGGLARIAPRADELEGALWGLVSVPLVTCSSSSC